MKKYGCHGDTALWVRAWHVRATCYHNVQSQRAPIIHFSSTMGTLRSRTVSFTQIHPPTRSSVSMAWLANNGAKVTWSLKLYVQRNDDEDRKLGKSVGWVRGNLAVMVSRPPSPLSQSGKPTELWREEERIYSWLLLWVPCQNKPLWWVCVSCSRSKVPQLHNTDCS